MRLLMVVVMMSRMVRMVDILCRKYLEGLMSRKGIIRRVGIPI